MFTRDEFEKELLTSAETMNQDSSLKEKALSVFVEADKHRWIHQSKWLGEPTIQLTTDLFALQEMIYATKPDYIFEMGVAWGGSILFYATLCQAWGHGRVIGVDTYMPDDLKERLLSHGKISERITLINASSTDSATVNLLRDMTKGSERILINLDSNHSHEHVLNELRVYSEFMSPGQYLICTNTVIDRIPLQAHRPRPWGPDNNPMTALKAFLKENDRFEIDTYFENKLLFTCNPMGVLKCTKRK